MPAIGVSGNWGLTVTQRVSGAYRLVTIPSIHKGLMFSLGANRAITRYVNEVLQPAPGMKMLDVGCGPANILPYLPPLDYTGIDLNEKHIDYARQRYGNGERFIVGNAAVDLKPKEKQFDLINVSALLHHITDDEAISLFASLTALVKPNGRIATIDLCLAAKAARRGSIGQSPGLRNQHQDSGGISPAIERHGTRRSYPHLERPAAHSL
jgi:ubiquinone/menaquinone biosynthesis C-methylase UbiE